MKNIKLDKRKNEPIATQLINEIQNQIVNSIWVSSKKMPDAAELASFLSISTDDVNLAYQTLMKKGIVLKKDDGYYPFQLMIPTMYFDQVLSIDQMFDIFNLKLDERVLEEKIVTTPTTLLDYFNSKDEFVYLNRLYWANGFPIVLMKSFIPVKLFPQIKNIKLGGLAYWDYLKEHYDSKPVYVKQTIKTIRADEPMISYLELNSQSIISEITLYFYDKSNRLVDHIIAYAPANSLIFKAEFDLKD